MSACFKCGLTGGYPYRGMAMAPGWYLVDAEMAKRTVVLCEDCYRPDPLEASRKATTWEMFEVFLRVEDIPDIVLEKGPPGLLRHREPI